MVPRAIATACASPPSHHSGLITGLVTVVVALPVVPVVVVAVAIAGIVAGTDDGRVATGGPGATLAGVAAVAFDRTRVGVTFGGRVTGVAGDVVAAVVAGLHVPLLSGRWRVMITLIDWDAEPGQKDAGGKPAPAALPDFVLPINPEPDSGPLSRRDTDIRTTDPLAAIEEALPADAVP